MQSTLKDTQKKETLLRLNDRIWTNYSLADHKAAALPAQTPPTHPHPPPIVSRPARTQNRINVRRRCKIQRADSILKNKTGEYSQAITSNLTCAAGPRSARTLKNTHQSGLISPQIATSGGACCFSWMETLRIDLDSCSSDKSPPKLRFTFATALSLKPRGKKGEN